MDTRQVGLRDVSAGKVSRWRVLAPLRYLTIHAPDKSRYDFAIPFALGTIAGALIVFVSPRPALFGDAGLLTFAREFLAISVPFIVGALASVAMGAPGGVHLDRRPVGIELYLDGKRLTLRQFVCYALGYLAFIGICILIAIVGLEVFREPFLDWTASSPWLREVAFFFVAFVSCYALASLLVTVLWSLYFLTVVINPEDGRG